MKGLRKKTTLVVIIPLIIGVVLTASAGMIPWFIISPEMLEDYTSHMIDNQKVYLQNSSSLISKIASTTYTQQFANSVNIGGDLMQKYYFYSLSKTNLNYSTIIPSYTQYVEQTSSYQTLYNQSFWFYNNYSNYIQLDSANIANLNSSAVFNPIISSISQINSKIYNGAYISSYLVFSDEGLYLRNPSELTTFGPNCPGNKNSTYYDPRCSTFYNKILQNKGISNAVIAEPYYFGDYGYGQTVCRPQWNYTNSYMKMAYCIDFNQSRLTIEKLWRTKATDNNHIYSYIVSPQGYILEYKGKFTYSMVNESIITQEISNNSNSDTKYYEDHIMPLFQFENTKLTHYKKNGEKMIASISPIMLYLSSDTQTFYGSVAVVMKNDKLEDQFDSLKSKCKTILFNEIYVSATALFIIIIICALLTDSLSKSLISPIDNLLVILNRMIGGDLEVNIMASLKPSPTEILNLYEVFDKLRVVLRFTSICTKDLTQASLIYSQALNLFIQFKNLRAMEICYKELGYIYAQKGIWAEAAVFLFSSLQLAEKSGEIENVELVRRKIDAAEVMCKLKEYKRRGTLLLKESLEILKEFNVELETCELYLLIGQIAYEAGKRSKKYLLEIKKCIDMLQFPNKSIAFQRFLYIRGIYLKNNEKIKEACKCFVIVLEEFYEYVPEIREKVIKELQRVFENNEDINGLSKFNPSIKSHNKDVVLILSTSIAQQAISCYVSQFIESIIEKNDRLAAIQFHHKVKVLFNITKSPTKFINFKEYKLDPTVLLFDALAEGIKQIELKKNFLLGKNRQSWIIVITDVNDTNSTANVDKICKDLVLLEINIIFVTINVENEVFKEICSVNDSNFVVEVNRYSNFEYALKEVEAFLCPEKEVYHSNEEYFF